MSAVAMGFPAGTWGESACLEPIGERMANAADGFKPAGAPKTTREQKYFQGLTADNTGNTDEL